MVNRRLDPVSVFGCWWWPLYICYNIYKLIFKGVKKKKEKLTEGPNDVRSVALYEPFHTGRT